jgi:hypothetical protein
MGKFKDNHPKVPLFFAAASESINEGSIIEINVQTAEGKSLCTNMKVTADDLALVRLMKESLPKS